MSSTISFTKNASLSLIILFSTCLKNCLLTLGFSYQFLLETLCSIVKKHLQQKHHFQFQLKKVFVQLRSLLTVALLIYFSYYVTAYRLQFQLNIVIYLRYNKIYCLMQFVYYTIHTFFSSLFLSCWVEMA